MSESPSGDEYSGRRRFFSTVGVILLLLGSVLLAAVRGFMDELGFTTASWLLIIGCIVMAAGAAILLRYSRISLSAGKEATSILIKALILGVGLLLLGFVMIFVLVVQLPMEERTIPFLFSFGLIFAGLFVAVGGRIMFELKRGTVSSATSSDVIKSFLQIKPEKNFETKNFSVMKKGEVYILLSKMSRAVYFVKLFNQVPTDAKVVKLPMMFLGGLKFEDEVAGLPVAKSRAEITIPVDLEKHGDKISEKYVKGRGVSYLAPLYDAKERRDVSKELSRTVILNIAREVSSENP